MGSEEEEEKEEEEEEERKGEKPEATMNWGAQARGRGWRTGELPSNLNDFMPFSIHVEDRFANNVEGHLPYISKAIQHTF